MSKYKFNNGYIYSDKFKLPMTRVVEILNEMHEKLEAYMKELPNFKATRENLEKIAKDAQGDFVEVEEGEKWTHTYFNIRCRIMDLDPDEFGTVVIIKNGGDYALAHPSKLKPIKPTISASEAFRLCLKSEVSAYYVMSRYNVEEVSTND